MKASVRRYSWDDFRIIEEIGSGGMSKIFKASYVGNSDILQNRKYYVIKVLQENLSRDERIKKRFLQEFEILSKLSHPNVLHVFGWLRSNQNHLGIICEYIDGMNLSQLIKSGILTGNLREVRNLAIKITDGLNYLHMNGIIHRDLKPSNILVTGNNIKIIDFGISKAFNVDINLTNTNIAIGTLIYMSPEQIEDSKSVTKSADLYSFGVLLWEMIMGYSPYKDCITQGEIIAKIYNKRLPDTNTIFDSIIKRCTEKDPIIRSYFEKELIGKLKIIDFEKSNSNNQRRRPNKKNHDRNINDRTIHFDKSKNDKKVGRSKLDIKLLIYLLIVLITLVSLVYMEASIRSML